MIDHGKRNVLGVLIDAVDYEAAVEKIIRAAHTKQSYSISALAVHGVMTGVLDSVHRHRLNNLDLVTPDGQPVRWALNLLYKTNLVDRVYGPTLTTMICQRAAQEQVPIFLYGNKQPVLEQLILNLHTRFPGIEIAGCQPSLFRQISVEERLNIVNTIKESGAAITLVGLGCPRQEVWVYEYRNLLSMPMMAVGAAFDFHAGTLPQAPAMMQGMGLEWLYRLWREPARLWRRYLYLNPHYASLLALQALRIKKFDPTETTVPTCELHYA